MTHIDPLDRIRTKIASVPVSGLADYPVLTLELIEAVGEFRSGWVDQSHRQAMAADGATDDRAKFATADASSNASQNSLKAGSYRIGSSIALSSRWGFVPGALVIPDAGINISYASPPEAGEYQIFDCSNSTAAVNSVGTVTGVAPFDLTGQNANARWFGMAPGSTIDTTLLESAALSVPGGVLEFTGNGTYAFNGAQLSAFNGLRGVRAPLATMQNLHTHMFAGMHWSGGTYTITDASSAAMLRISGGERYVFEHQWLKAGDNTSTDVEIWPTDPASAGIEKPVDLMFFNERFEREVRVREHTNSRWIGCIFDRYTDDTFAGKDYYRRALENAVMVGNQWMSGAACVAVGDVLVDGGQVRNIVAVGGTAQGTVGITSLRPGNGESTGSGLLTNVIVGDVAHSGIRFVMRNDPLLTFSASAKTILRADNGAGPGMWKDDGAFVGRQFTLTGSASNDGTYTIAAVSAKTLTVVEALVNEGPVSGVSIVGTSLPKVIIKIIPDDGAVVRNVIHHDIVFDGDVTTGTPSAYVWLKAQDAGSAEATIENVLTHHCIFRDPGGTSSQVHSGILLDFNGYKTIKDVFFDRVYVDGCSTYAINVSNTIGFRGARAGVQFRACVTRNIGGYHYRVGNAYIEVIDPDYDCAPANLIYLDPTAPGVVYLRASGIGSPEGVVPACPGSEWTRKPGYFDGSVNVTFAEVGATGDTITLASGTWAALGFATGDNIQILNSASNNITTTAGITISGAVLTLDTDDLVAEGPVGSVIILGLNGSRYLKATGSDENGWQEVTSS